MSKYRSEYLASQHCHSVCADTQGYKDIAIGQVYETEVYSLNYPWMDPTKGKYMAQMDDVPDGEETRYQFGNDPQELIKWVIATHKELWQGK